MKILIAPVAGLALGLILGLAQPASAQVYGQSTYVPEVPGQQPSYGYRPAAADGARQPRALRPPEAPRMPNTPSMPASEAFHPFHGTSVYSNRGGVDAYPKPAKPKGYVPYTGPQ